MRGTIRKVAVVVGLLMLALLVNANWVQVVRADRLNDDPNNTRILIEEYSNERGPILVSDTAVARSVRTDGLYEYQRVYDAGPEYAAVTGFYSIVYGRTGIERAENDILSGGDSRLRSNRDLITGESGQGGAVVLSIDPAAQRAAYDALTATGQRGAVAALNPTTGEILALVSSPSFDPNALVSFDTSLVTQNFETLEADPNQPLLNRPLARTYPPGSTFKVVDTAAALSSGAYTPETELPGPATLALPGTSATISNFGGRACGGGTVTLTEALVTSCNTAFAQLGLDLGQDALRQQAEKFGFNSEFDVPMRAANSVFPSGLNEPQTAQSAIGQFDVRATALQMAMVAAGVGNRGVVMSPYLVRERLAPDLSVLESTEPKEFGRAVTPEVAQQVVDMMVAVVSRGTGRAAQIPDVAVGGKTGTAQTTPDRPPHAWFISFAPAQDPRVAVAVIVEDGGNIGDEATGGRVAAPIAKAVMQAVLGGTRQ